MNSAAFLSAVKQEIARLQQIQNLLENASANVPSGSATKQASGERRGMSEAGKARVAEAQRKRWAAKKAAAEAEPAATKKQAAAPVKKSGKTTAAAPTAKKQRASASKSTAGKTAASAKKAPVKKSTVATKPSAAKKASAANTASAPKKQVRRMRQKPDSNLRVEAPEVNAPVLNAAPAVPEDGSSSE